MKTLLLFPWLLSLLAPFLSAAEGLERPALNLTLKNGSTREIETKAQLEKVLREYDVSKWIFTTEVLIDQDVIPHSHPVLTLNTNNLGQDLRLLSEFVHEQLHWFEEANPEERDRTIAELEELFPDLPTRPPDSARNRHSSYLHLIVCYLEFEALKELAGAENAREVFEFWAGHHYRAIYRTVLDQPDRIRTVVEKHNLIP
jgi:hypothetical protein